MRSICLLSMFISFSSFGFCQKTDDIKKEQNWPVVIAFSTHSYSWPIVKSFVTPIQPGFKIGTEYVYSAKRNHKTLQSFNLGYFHNPEFLNAYYLNSYFTYRYTTSFNLFFDGAIGAGYIHRRHSREVFKLNDNGEYESKTDWGSPGVQAGVNLGVGYNFSISERPIGMFFNYEWFVNYPHVKGNVPFLPHSLYHIGIRFYPFN
jgi:hypothetical protein